MSKSSKSSKEFAKKMKKMLDDPNIVESLLKIVHALSVDDNVEKRTTDRRQVSKKPETFKRSGNIRRTKKRNLNPCSSTESESHASNVRDVGSNPTGGANINAVFVQEWIESERGWGCRPDGASLHLTKIDADNYVKDYWETMPGETPDEYSRPDGSPKILYVDDDTLTKIKSSKNGIRLWEYEYKKHKVALK